MSQHSLGIALVDMLIAGYKEQNELIADLSARVWILEQQVDDVEARENYKKQAEQKASEFVAGTRKRHQEMLSLLHEFRSDSV